MNLAESGLVYPKVKTANILLRLISRVLSLIYFSVIFLRNSLFDSGIRTGRRLPGKVISVGNIAVGGTGKTPVVMEIASYLRKQGARPAVLTRGYGSGLKHGQWLVMLAGKVVGGKHTSTVVLPDEGRLQSVECPEVPVIAGPARFRAASEYLEGLNATDRPTHWILDDGFQHRQLHRDFDIVLLDKGNPFGNQSVLPFGCLREPIAALRRASHILLTGENGTESKALTELQSQASNLSINIGVNISADLKKDVLGNTFFIREQHLPALLVAGIARPERLRRDLKNAGIECFAEVILPDHGLIKMEEISRHAQAARSIITTSKDYWRNPEFFCSLKIPVFLKKMRIEVPESLLAVFLP